MSSDCVVTGLGTVSPIGIDETAFWDGLTTGRSGAAQVTGFDVTELTRKIGCQIHEPVTGEPAEGRAAQLALSASRQAIDSAGLSAEEMRDARVAVVVGTTMGETGYIERPLLRDDQDTLTRPQLRDVVQHGPGSIAGQLISILGLHGSALDLYGACAAGNMALSLARQQLREGRCGVALVGGADGFSFLAFVGFMRARIMAEQVCRPFDVNRDGMFVGEGAGMFVLEPEDPTVKGTFARAYLCVTLDQW